MEWLRVVCFVIDSRADQELYTQAEVVQLLSLGQTIAAKENDLYTSREAAERYV